jgi:hypothetical protein
MAGERSETTATLRETLLTAIERVLNGSLESRDALAIAKLSSEVVKTAELEMRYTGLVDSLDSSGNGNTPGPLLLTDRKTG